MKFRPIRLTYLPEKLQNIMILLKLRHDKVQVERSGGDDVNDVDWSSDEDEVRVADLE